MASSTQSIFGTAPRKLIVNYLPHAGQDEVTDALRANFSSPNPAAIVEIIASRGWGKTLYMVCELLVPYLTNHPNAKVMWVAPTYQVGMSPIDDVFKGVNEVTGEPWVPEFDPYGNRVWEFVNTQSGPLLRWYTGATVTIKSADSADSIVSRGYNLIIIDEAALISELVFTQQILGTARKAGIKIFMISSPRGKKHFTYKYYLKGQDPKDLQYLSFQQPYTKNPHFSPVLAALIKDLPDWLYRQEYLAEFIEDGDSVFRNLNGVMVGPEITFNSNQQEWEVEKLLDVTIKGYDGDIIRRAAERRFICAMDLAKSIDYTVITVFDIETGDMVYYKRLNKTDYREVLRLASSICKRFNAADLIFDATGVGSGLADFLNNYDVTAHPYVFTNDSKNDLVTRLALAIEYQEIKMPNITTIRNELEVYTYTLTRTGKISFNAPSGFHDDVVMSIALANWYRKENVGSDDLGVIDEIIKVNAGSPGSGRGSFVDFMDNDND